MKKNTTRRLTESAILIALGTVLSLIKIDLPFGGGVTICSMLPVVILSFRYGWKWGGFAGFAYSVLQLLLGLDNVQYASSAVMAAGIVLLDYILPYTVIGFASLFGGKPTNTRKALVLGIIVSFVLRLVCHIVTGAWIWGEWMPEEFMNMAMTSPWIYSILYNGWYMLAEIVLTVIVAMAIYNPLKRFIHGEDLKKA
jgi:thiamine transporter